MKKIALNLLGWLASLIAKKYLVKIVAITGSVGKTTTKEAVYAVLKQTYRVERSLYNANTEWGIVASVISPGFEPTFTASGKAKISVAQMLGLIWQAKMKLLFSREYPQILVLEMAADKPDDIAWFNRWFNYDVAVITTIGSSHLEFYPSQAELTAEKLSLTNKVKKTGLVVINGECEECSEWIAKSPMRKVTFGLDDRQNVWAEQASGQHYVLHSSANNLKVSLPIGRQFVPAGLIAMAVGEEFGLTARQIEQGLAEFQPISGRFQIHKTNQWTIVDDAYNASPESMRVALNSLQDIGGKRRVAILGGMRELGSATESGHKQVGAWASKTVDLLIVVGREGAMIADGALQAGMSQTNVVKIKWEENNPDVDSVVSQLLPILEEGDSVLVKASRAIHLDKLVSKLLTQKMV